MQARVTYDYACGGCAKLETTASPWPQTYCVKCLGSFQPVPHRVLPPRPAEPKFAGIEGMSWRMVPWWGWCVAAVLLLSVVGAVFGGNGDPCFEVDLTMLGEASETVCTDSNGDVYSP